MRVSLWGLPQGVLAVALALSAGSALAAPPDAPTFTLVLRDHRFTPNVFTAPIGQKLRIVLINQDTATEEFDSHDLKVEEIVTPGSRISFTVGPLKRGVYHFMGEFHPQTAQGMINAVFVAP